MELQHLQPLQSVGCGLSEGTPSLFGHLYYKQEKWEPSPRTTTAVAHTFSAFASHAEG